MCWDGAGGGGGVGWGWRGGGEGVGRHEGCGGDYQRSSVERDRLVGLVVKATASRAEDPGFESRFAPGFFRGRVIPVT